jgi:hypothetical protein
MGMFPAVKFILTCWQGFEKPSGVFIELNTTVYADPHLRLLFGVTV